MSRSVLPVLAAALVCLAACSGAWAEEQPAPAVGPKAVRPHGIFTHGDSSGFMEDFYGDSVERTPSDDAATGTRKHDPAVNWDDRRVRR